MRQSVCKDAMSNGDLNGDSWAVDRQSGKSSRSRIQVEEDVDLSEVGCSTETLRLRNHDKVQTAVKITWMVC